MDLPSAVPAALHRVASGSISSSSLLASNGRPSSRYPLAAARWRSKSFKLDYLEIARLLGQLRIEDAPEWALFPQQEQELLAMYHARCLSRWGVNMRSSGWERFCRSWRWDVAFVPVCMALAVHPWWFAL